MNIYLLKGVDDVEFGMNVLEVRKIILGKFEEFRRIEFFEELRDKYLVDYFFEKGVFCYYDEGGCFEVMEFMNFVKFMFGGVDMLNIVFCKVDVFLGNLDNEVI